MLNLFYCSTSGARDWHGRQQPSPCPGTATLSLHPAPWVSPPSTALETPEATLEKALLGAQIHTRAKLCCRDEDPSRALALGSQGWTGQAEPGRGCGTLGCRNLGAHGGRQSLAGAGSCRGCRAGVPCPVPRTWAGCPMPSAWCSGCAGAHRPVECSVPLPVPAHCPEPEWCQCWCQGPELSAWCMAHSAASGAWGWHWWLYRCQCQSWWW